MPFTPDERVSMSDPVLRVLGHKTTSIVLADDAEYSLGGTDAGVVGYAEGVYEVAFTHPDLDRRVGEMKAEVSMPAPPANYGNRAADSNDTANQTSPFITLTEFDEAGGEFADETEFTTSAAHNLSVGDWVTVAYDADVDLTTGIGDGTLADIDGDVQVTAVVDSTHFSVTIAAFSGATGDDSIAAADANLYIDGHGDPSYRKLVRNITLADGAAGTAPVDGATIALCEDTWDGEIWVTDRSIDGVIPFVIDAGAAAYGRAGEFAETGSALDAPILPMGTTEGTTELWAAVGDVDPFTNATQGLGIDSDLIYLYNETAAEQTYDVEMRNSPVVGHDLDNYVCLYSRDNVMRLRNRTGQSQTLSIRRVS